MKEINARNVQASILRPKLDVQVLFLLWFIYVMCLNKQVADFCMFHKILGLVCCCLFGNILEITAHCSWEHLQMVTSRLHVFPYFMYQISTFSHSQSVIFWYQFFCHITIIFPLDTRLFLVILMKKLCICRNCLLKKNFFFVF